MKTYRLFTAICLATAALFSACTQDELAEQGNTLPEGKYPLQIASVTMDVTTSEQPWSVGAPQTRVSENPDGNSSKWDGRETIHVKLGNQETAYQVTGTDGTLTLTGEQLYWTKRTDNVTAWYAEVEENSIINLANQSDKLAYVLQAKADNASCGEAVTLNFTHALAKVRVVLRGDKASKVNDVSIKSYTECTHTNGENVSGKSEGEIRMHSVGNNTFEANVVPGYEITQIKVNEKESTLTKSLTPQAAKVNTITLTVNKEPLQPGEDGKFTIDGGDVIIKDYTGTAPIVVNGDATITIRNVKLETTGDVMTINNGVNVTLNIEGTDNEFTSTTGAGIKIMGTNSASQRGNITINGKGTNNSKLKITAKDGAAVGFRMVGDGSVYCGDININDITLEATGGSKSPAIGISKLKDDAWDTQKQYGNISISSSNITASSSGGAACIGTPYHDTSSPFSLGVISIGNSTVTATADGNQAACIGFGYTGGGFNDKVIQKIEFTNTTLNLTTGAANKVGFGAGDESRQLTEGIWHNGSKVGDTGWNP